MGTGSKEWPGVIKILIRTETKFSSDFPIKDLAVSMFGVVELKPCNIKGFLEDFQTSNSVFLILVPL